MFTEILIKSNPNFINLSTEEQERYCLSFFDSIENEDIFNKEMVLKLFGVEISDDFICNMSSQDYKTLNKKRAELSGFGINKILCSEPFAHERSISTFKTVYDYDIALQNDKLELFNKDSE